MSNGRPRRRPHHRAIPITSITVIPRGEVQTMMDFDEQTGAITITVFPFQPALLNLRYELTAQGRADTDHLGSQDKEDQDG